jgi:cysteine synthase B
VRSDLSFCETSYHALRKARHLPANKKHIEKVQYFGFFHTIVATLISVSIMTNTQTDFLAEEFLLDYYVGKSPLVRLQRLASHTQATVLAKLEGNNPAGSVKDRPAYNMIIQAEKRGQIKPGDTLIEATSGNTGIALAMVAAMRGYKMILIMPNNMSQERKDAMSAYGAELIEVTQKQGMEGARDLAMQMQAEGKGLVLNQFGNPDNVEAHYLTTGPEIWKQTGGKITHFVSSMGTTGTIMGVSKYLKEQNPDIQIVGLQPSDGSSIAGIRRWPEEYLPTIFDRSRVDRIIDIPQIEAERTMRKLARHEGISAGTSSGGAVWASIKIAEENPDAVIVCIICDRGDRYLSTGLFSVQD